MILFVTTVAHRDTHQSLMSDQKEVEVRVASYEEVVGKDPQHATYVFTDFDRLPGWRVREAAIYYRILKKEGRRVLNDPARAAERYGLLRRLHHVDINDFNVYRADELVQPHRWPVFVRMEGSHAYPLTDLLHGPDELRRALQKCIRAGYPRTTLLIIEYAAEPVRPGLFRRLSVFRLGETYLGYTCAHDDNWIVKYGKPAIAPRELYEEEYGFVRDNPFGDALRPAFEFGGIDYGRADFGFVDGKPQIYEINTNPDIRLFPKPSTVPRRNDSYELFRANYLAALKAIDTPL